MGKLRWKRINFCETLYLLFLENFFVVEGNLRKIELTTPEGLPARIQSIKISLEKIYGAKLSVEFRVLPVRSLCSTENFLEKDKLALIFMKIVDEGYRVPIITVRKGGEYYVLDGHHRSYILAKMMEETVESYVLRFPEEVSYRAPPRRPIEEIPVIDVAPIRDPILRAWSQIIILLKYYIRTMRVRGNGRNCPLCFVPSNSDIRWI